MLEFQSTLPQGERPKRVQNLLDRREFQSTLPQGERPILIDIDDAEQSISIHAPTRGATSVTPDNTVLYEFQSTLPQGERRM